MTCALVGATSETDRRRSFDTGHHAGPCSFLAGLDGSVDLLSGLLTGGSALGPTSIAVFWVGSDSGRVSRMVLDSSTVPVVSPLIRTPMPPLPGRPLSSIRFCLGVQRCPAVVAGSLRKATPATALRRMVLL